MKGLAKSIGAMTSLVKLNLKSCNLTSSSIDDIFENLTINGSEQSSLTSLNFSGNYLQGLSKMKKFLAKSTSSGYLEYLKLSQCSLGDPELKQLSQGLMASRSLRVLDLSQNQIKNVSHIKEGIMSNIGLEKLDLSSNQIDNEGL